PLRRSERARLRRRGRERHRPPRPALPRLEPREHDGGKQRDYDEGHRLRRPRRVHPTVRARPQSLRQSGARPPLRRRVNGSWWYGQSPRANPSLTTADFVAAWRRVVDIFRQEGAFNVSWAWVAVTPPPAP